MKKPLEVFAAAMTSMVVLENEKIKDRPIDNVDDASKPKLEEPSKEKL